MDRAHAVSITAVDKNMVTYHDCEVLLRALQLQFFQIQNYVVRPLDELKSFFAKYGELLVTVYTKDRFEKMFFLVQNTSREDHKFILAERHKGIGSEQFIHQIFFQDVLKAYPNVKTDVLLKCYLTRGEFVIFEDILQFEFANTRHFDLAHIKAAFESLATLHTCSILLAQKMKTPLCDLYKDYFKEPIFYYEEGTKFQIVNALVESINKYVEANASVNAPTKAKMDHYLAEFMELMNTVSKEYLSVICHGNPFPKTLLFKYEDRQPTRCKLLNFQMYRYAPPAFDIMYLMNFTMDEDDRLEMFDQLITHYYQILTLKLYKLDMDVTNILPVHEFETTCRKYCKATKFLRYLFHIFALAIEGDLWQVVDNKGFIIDKMVECLWRYELDINWVLEKIDEALKPEYIYVTQENIYRLASNSLHAQNFQIVQHHMEPLELYDYYKQHEYYILKLVLLENMVRKEFEMFVKAVTLDKPRKKFTKLFGGPLKEYRYYRNMVPLMEAQEIFLLSDISPRCWLAHSDNVLILEDLRENYYTKTMREPFNMEDVTMVVAKMAQLHASVYVHEELATQKLGKTYRLIEEYPETLKEVFFNKSEHSLIFLKALEHGLSDAFDYFAEDLGSMDVNYFKERVREYCLNLNEMTKPSVKYRNTIVHGELWTNNILFPKPGTPATGCKFVDWETFRYNSPAQDLVSFMHLNTNRRFRQTYMSQIATFYYNTLRDILKKYNLCLEGIFRFGDFMVSIEENTPYAIVLNCMVQHTAFQTQEQLEEFNKVQGLAHKFFTESRADRIIYLCSIDMMYKERQREVILDLLHLVRQTFGQS